MPVNFRVCAIAALAAVLALGPLGLATTKVALGTRQAEADALEPGVRPHHHHFPYGHAALRMFGRVVGTITGLAAPDTRPWHCGYGVGCDDGDGPPPPSAAGPLGSF